MARPPRSEPGRASLLLPGIRGSQSSVHGRTGARGSGGSRNRRGSGCAQTVSGSFCPGRILLLCLPSMQLFPYAPPSLVSDRFLAIAVWPAILLIVAMSWRLQPLLRTGLLLIIALTWTAQTAKHPLDWRSPEVLINNDLRAYPGYSMPAAYKIFDIQLPQRLYGDAIKTAGSIANPLTKDALV